MESNSIMVLKISHLSIGDKLTSLKYHFGALIYQCALLALCFSEDNAKFYEIISIKSSDQCYVLSNCKTVLISL